MILVVCIDICDRLRPAPQARYAGEAHTTGPRSPAGERSGQTSTRMARSAGRNQKFSSTRIDDAISERKVEPELQVSARHLQSLRFCKSGEIVMPLPPLVADRTLTKLYQSQKRETMTVPRRSRRRSMRWKGRCTAMTPRRRRRREWGDGSLLEPREDDRLGAPEDEIDRLTEAFQLGELPFPGTDENLVKFKPALRNCVRCRGRHKALCKSIEISIPCRTRSVRNIGTVFFSRKLARLRKTAGPFSLFLLNQKPMRLLFTQDLQCCL
jgi:hypothetical protein